MARKNWNEAVSKARGEEMTGEVPQEVAVQRPEGPVSLSTLTVGDFSDFITPANAEEIAAEMEAGELESAPQLLDIPEGTQFTAFVIRSGVARIEDIQTKEVKDVKNWHLQLLGHNFKPGPKVSILGSAQLDRQLETLIGKVAKIAKGGLIRTPKKRFMWEYYVGEVTTNPARAAAKALRGE
jgi:hypothetical protein